LFVNAYSSYNAVVSGYDTTKTKYETDAKAYNTAVEDRKKDPKKELPARPDKPTPPAAYSGMKLLLSGQILSTVTETWGTEIKKLTGTEAVLATTFASSVYSYDQLELAKSFHNRIGYLVASGTNDKAKTAGVGATFGRLGQGVQTTFAKASPFLWTTADANAKPGMQVSLLPEYAGSGSWVDWTVTTKPTIQYGVKQLATLSSFEAPAAASASTVALDGASQMAAATAVAAAAIAATMY
jgi:hypothetical protein